MVYYFIVCSIIISLPLIAQVESDSQDTTQINYFYEPYPQDVGASILQLGGSFTLLPTSLVENEYPTPAIDLQYKRGIIENFSAIGSFSTNYFTNLLHLGIQWNFNKDNFSLGIANHLGGFEGHISIDGQFDNNAAYAFFDLPILRIGYRFDDFSVSMSWAFSYVFKSVNKVSDLRTRGPERTINDFFCTIAVEQPFLKSTHISIGLSLAYSRTPYQSWLLFNTIDEYLFVPEFFFGFQL